MEMKNKGAPKMAKGNDQKRHGELESTMASKIIEEEEVSQDIPLFFVANGVKSKPKLKL